MLSRRNFLTGSAVALVGAAAVSGRAEAAAIPEAESYASPAMRPPLPPPPGQAYQPVVTLNGWTLPWQHERRVEGVPSRRRAGVPARDRAGHDRQSSGATTARRPGPTIEAVEGDRVRILVDQHASRKHTTVHWHGMHASRTAWTA